MTTSFDAAKALDLAKRLRLTGDVFRAMRMPAPLYTDAATQLEAASARIGELERATKLELAATAGWMQGIEAAAKECAEWSRANLDAFPEQALAAQSCEQIIRALLTTTTEGRGPEGEKHGE